MAGNFNLKTVFSADTKDLKKGAAEAKQAVKDFDDTTTSALNEIAGLFGTSMGDISKTLSSVRGGFLKLSSGLSATAQGAGVMSKALNVLKIALASTGIGLIVVALGSLVTYFTKSQDGANKLAIIMGQLKQVFLVISDAAIAIGRKIIEAFTKTFNFFESRFKLFKQRAGISTEDKEGENAEKNVFQRRRELTLRQQALEKAMIDYTVEKARIQTEIEKQREIAADKANRTAAERLAANLKAQELTAALYEKEKGFAQERLDIMIEENSLSESMNVDLQAQADLEAELINLEGQRASRTKELLAQQAELTVQVKKEREDLEKIAALRAQGALQKMDGSNVLGNVKVATNQKNQVEFKDTPSIAYARRKAEYLKQMRAESEQELVDFKQIAIDFSDAVADAFSSMIEGLVSGNLNIKDVFASLLNFLADNLKKIGKALIAYGVALKAFREAWKGPEGAVKAIAAGAALVAIGSVLSGLVNRMSSGGSGMSPSASYAAATVSGGTLDLTGKTSYSRGAQEIRVTGTLKAAGSQLVAVIENEGKRKLLTT